MMHGPCGTSNLESLCMVDGVCSKKFPNEFAENTLVDADGYPQYRRRKDGQYVEKKGVHLDNRYVVPYNPYLSIKYNAHINVEICNSVCSCKYLYKYVYKGPGMGSVSTQVVSQNRPDEQDESSSRNIDEIKKFVNSRFLTPSEGFWRILSFDTHGREPSIQRLAVHEENKQLIMFAEENPEEAILNPKDTTLLA